MSEHLSPLVLSALADGELRDDEFREAKHHLDHCLPCSSAAVDHWLLKGAVSRGGYRHEMSKDFAERMKAMMTAPVQQLDGRYQNALRVRPNARWGVISGLATAAVLLVTIGTGVLVGVVPLNRIGANDGDALTGEVTDDHVAMMAANQPPQVLSNDRHTVKPWFQGKIPFSFNLPSNLPADITLTGANLSYLRHQPVAQLIFMIGKHKASLFLCARGSTSQSNLSLTRDGFHVIGLSSQDLEVIAVSDVDSSRLSELANLVKDAQAAP
jgi:anti-sigma factor RsiW